METPEIVLQGKENGEGMIIRYRSSRGTEVFGLAVPNLWGGEGWDLGPTWCYLLLGERTILIDTGRFGNFEVLQQQLERIGRRLSDIEAIIITHSHEDHDGNLPEVINEANPELWAHELYHCMISYYPEVKGNAPHPELPGSCRFCVMPESFYSECIPYHRRRSGLKVDLALNEEVDLPVGGLAILSTPGHTPDSICIILDDEVIFTGDTVLPGITPHPSMERAFEANRLILPPRYQERNEVYGLMTYINSLRKISGLGSQRFSATFPGHRLFYNGRFNLIHETSERAGEIIRFHMDRCGDILRILGNGPKALDDIAEEHFLPSQLKGSGRMMARSELTAHIEVMEVCGDVRWIDETGEMVEHTETYNCLNAIKEYLYDRA
ncbi:MAG: MBL fold metallo-hydrolase [Dehalococcoidia bacterium]